MIIDKSTFSLIFYLGVVGICLIYIFSPFLSILLEQRAKKKLAKRICKEIEAKINQDRIKQFSCSFRISSVVINSVNEEVQEFYFYSSVFFRRPFAEQLQIPPSLLQSTLVAMNLTQEDLQELSSLLCRLKNEVDSHLNNFEFFFENSQCSFKTRTKRVEYA